jgi:hypothetical protein
MEFIDGMTLLHLVRGELRPAEQRPCDSWPSEVLTISDIREMASLCEEAAPRIASAI